MERLKLFVQSKFYIELIVAITLFSFALYLDNMIIIIINLLYFIIMLEIVRAVVGFLREQRIKIGILIDAFIVLTLREFIVNVVKINKENINSIEALFSNNTNYHIMIFSGVLIFLFILRWIAMFTSPDKVCK